jgi:hypothetical protein
VGVGVEVGVVVGVVVGVKVCVGVGVGVASMLEIAPQPVLKHNKARITTQKMDRRVNILPL